MTKLNECYWSQQACSLGCSLVRCLVGPTGSSIHSLMRIADSHGIFHSLAHAQCWFHRNALFCGRRATDTQHLPTLHCSSVSHFKHGAKVRGGGQGVWRGSCHINTYCGPPQNWPAGLSHPHPHVVLKHRDERRPTHTEDALLRPLSPTAFAKH